MGTPQPLRFVLFCIVCGVLLGAAVAFSGAEEGPPPPSSHSPATSGVLSDQATAAQTRAVHAELEAAGRQFLTAFLSYEVGEGGAAVEGDLRRSASPAFAAELLSQPPRLPPEEIPPAVLGALEPTVISAVPPRAVISGTAKRGGKPEQFSFVFESRQGSWLAVDSGG